MSVKQINRVLVLIGLFPLMWWVYWHINGDLWYDEVISFKLFVLGGYDHTFLHYQVPNNHIFFNFTSQLISRLFGWRDFPSIVSHVYVFRIFQLFIVLGTAGYLIKISKEILKVDYWGMTVVLLFTTIPFLNFSLQLRGYNLSTFLLLVLVYHLWKLLVQNKRTHVILVGLASLLLMYTIPSNSYLLASVLVALGLHQLGYVKKERVVQTEFIWAISAILAGIGMAFLFYLPIIEQVLFNRFVAQVPDDPFISLALFPRIILAFGSNRILVFIGLLVGGYLIFTQSEKDEKKYFTFFVMLLILPFLVAFSHQKNPFQRVFSSLDVVFVLLAASAVLKAVSHFVSPKYVSISLVLVAIYSVGTFMVTRNMHEKEMRVKMVEENQIAQNMYKNYYLSPTFKPQQTIQDLSKKHPKALVLVYDQIDFPADSLYLEMNKVRFDRVKRFDTISELVATEKELFVLTTFENRTYKKLVELEQCQVEIINNDYPFTNSIKVTLR